MMSRTRAHWCWLSQMLAVLLVVAAMPLASEESPYVAMTEREIKALSAEEIQGYESAQGMGFALAAELNGYPGPKHVLELRQELALTDEQVLKTEHSYQEMKTAAENLGGQIVARERELDDLFTSHRIDAENLSEKVLEIAELQGRLRAVHLEAHLEMMDVLEQQQIMHYVQLRGYHGGKHSGHH